MPIDYSKFDNIVDSDDDEAPAKPPAAQPGDDAPGSEEQPPQAAAEHCRPCDDAPGLELPEGEFATYYKESMTSPQRMATMVHMWNSAEQSERIEFLRHLIDLINNPAISNKIKGGQEILKDLDASRYGGVTYPTKWLDDFKALALEDKKVAFEKFYKMLDPMERGLVVATLS